MEIEQEQESWQVTPRYGILEPEEERSKCKLVIIYRESKSQPSDQAQQHLVIVASTNHPLESKETDRRQEAFSKSSSKKGLTNHAHRKEAQVDGRQ